MRKIKWVKNEFGTNYIYANDERKVYLCYQPHDWILNSENTEIAIINDISGNMNRYLVFRGDKRKQLAKLYPDIDKLKKYWKKHGEPLWSDDLDND